MSGPRVIQPGELLRLGVVGLGDIAQKAYLPVLAARSDVALSLMTRDRDKLDQIGRQYAVTRCSTSLDDFLDGSIDAAFVHASTEAHPALVDRLLTAGVPVLVDKPLAPDLDGARRLVELAEGKGVSLAVGFNRRHAPAYTSLTQLHRSVILMQKNRIGVPEQPRRFVFDDFIHVIDTLRFLLPAGMEQVSIRCSVGDGLLRTLTVYLDVKDVTAQGVMHRVSGANEEVLEVLGNGHKHRITNLTEVWRHDSEDPDGVRLSRQDDWTPVSTQRGFTSMCAAFLHALRAGHTISARDALRTHEICEDIVQVAEAALNAGK